MRFSTQLIAAVALAAGTANASLYRRAHDASAISAVSTTQTDTNTNSATITSATATSTGGTHTMKHDHDPATTTETSSTESHATGALSSGAARPAQTSISLIKDSAATASSAAASPSAAAAGNPTAPVSRPIATGTGDYVGYVDHSAEPSSGGSHSTGSSSGSTGSGGSSGSSSDEGEASPKPTKALHTSPGSNLVMPGLGALGSLAVGLMVLV